MGFESVHQLREVELHLDTTGPMTFSLYSDLPGDEIIVRFTKVIDTEVTTVGPRTINIQLPGTTKGKLFRFKLHGANDLKLFGGRMLARPLGIEAAWKWYAVPVDPTPDWTTMKLPIDEPPDWSDLKLPIEETPDFQTMPLPIDETPDWAEMKLPIDETTEWLWVEMAEDAVE